MNSIWASSILPVRSPWKTWPKACWNSGTELSPFCHAAAAPKTMPYQSMFVEAFAVVVPDGVQLAVAAETLAVAGELLNVIEAVDVVGVDAAPVVDAGGDPGLKAGVGEGLDVAVEAVGLRVVGPGDGDSGVLEGLGHGLDEVGRMVGDVAPEEELAVQRLERLDDAVHELEVRTR